VLDIITLFVSINEIKVSQFQVLVNDFQPNDTDPMAKLVLAASDIEFLTPEVEEFRKSFEFWGNKNTIELCKASFYI
jgi:hypothetical protein